MKTTTCRYRCFLFLGLVLGVILPLLSASAGPEPRISGMSIKDGSLYLETSFTNQFILERSDASGAWSTVGLFTGAAQGNREWFRAISLEDAPAVLDDAIVFTPDSSWTLIRQGGAGDDAVYGPLVNQQSPASGSDLPAAPAGYGRVFWVATNGGTAYWRLDTNGVRASNGIVNTSNVPKSWNFGGAADINGDGRSEFFWCPTNEVMRTWFLDSNYRYVSNAILYGSLCPFEYQYRAAGDSSGDGYNDLFFQDIYFGYIDTWHLNPNGTLRIAQPTYAASINRDWRLQCCGDVSGDGRVELFFQNTNSGATEVWFMDTNGQRTVTRAIYGTPLPSGWTMRGAGDVSGDGRCELFFQRTNGATAIWVMNTNGVRTSGRTVFSTPVPNGWTMRGVADVSGDGRAELLWHNANGATAVWYLNTNGVRTGGRAMNSTSISPMWRMSGVTVDGPLN